MPFEPFVAEIRIFACNFAPKGWALCDGQLMSISQNTALFSLLGTNYGGDGKSTFGLPNIQGSAAMSAGQGPGLTERFLGEQGGSPSVTLLQTEIPFHTHTALASTDAGQFATPQNMYVGQGNQAYGPPQNLVSMNFQSLTPYGGSLPHNNLQPYLVFVYCIALQGVFPARP